MIAWNHGQMPPGAVTVPHPAVLNNQQSIFGGVPGGGGTAGGPPQPQIQNPIAGQLRGTNSAGNTGGSLGGVVPMSTIGNGVTVGQAAPQNNPLAPAPPSNTIASITSTFGNPILPYADQNLNQQTTNRLFENALGQQGMASMLQHLRPANNGMAATVGDQMLINPAITQHAAAGANALTSTPYQQDLGNANALLNWQTGQSNDSLGQFKNLAGLNEAQQNFGLSNLLGNMDYNLGTTGNRVDLLQSLLGGLMGPNSMIGNLTSGLTSGLGNALSGTLGGGLGSLGGLTGLA